MRPEGKLEGESQDEQDAAVIYAICEIKHAIFRVAIAAV